MSGHNQIPFQINSLVIEDIMQYDDKCFVRPGSLIRKAFLAKLLDLPAVTIVAVNENNEIEGYASRRITSSSNCYAIGPLYADNYEVAENLMVSLCRDLGNDDSVVMTVWWVEYILTFQLFNQIVRMDYSGCWGMSRDWSADNHFNQDTSEFDPNHMRIWLFPPRVSFILHGAIADRPLFMSTVQSFRKFKDVWDVWENPIWQIYQF